MEVKVLKQVSLHNNVSPPAYIPFHLVYNLCSSALDSEFHER